MMLGSTLITVGVFWNVEALMLKADNVIYTAGKCFSHQLLWPKHRRMLWAYFLIFKPKSLNF